MLDTIKKIFNIERQLGPSLAQPRDNREDGYEGRLLDYIARTNTAIKHANGNGEWGNMVSRTQLERIQTLQTLTIRWIVGDQYQKEDGPYLNKKELLEMAG